jgi:hypothetical protein
MKWFKDMLTEKDGQSFELLAALGAIGFAAVIVFQGYVTFKNGTFDPLTFTTGLGALLVSIGGGQKLKPQAPPDKVDTQ